MSKKVKKRRTCLSAVCAVVVSSLFLGCSSDAPEGEISQGKNVPVQIEGASVERLSATTRASLLTNLATDGVTVDLFMVYSPAGNNSKYEVPYTYSVDKQAWVASPPLYIGEEQANVYACYDPNNIVSFVGNSTKTSNELEIQAPDDKKLWYYDFSNKDINHKNRVLSFVMKCAYSRLSLTLSRTATYPNDCKISSITVKPASGTFYTEGTVDIADGSLTGTPKPDYTINTSNKPMNTVGIAANNPDTSIDFMIPAQQVANGITFALTVDGTEYSVTVANFTEFKRGVRHIAHLEMAETGLVIGGVTVADWQVIPGSNSESNFD